MTYEDAIRAAIAAEPALAALFSRQPAYRYWTDPRDWCTAPAPGLSCCW